MFPPPGDHAEDVLFCSSVSNPCRVLMYIVKLFNLPVDFCGIDFAKDLNCDAALEKNPIHSVPWLNAYQSGGNAVGINGSETIIDYLCSKYRPLIPDTFYPLDPLERADTMQKYHFINSVLYRSTVYQYVYPMMGLMTECQYDLCKRDFALNIVNEWCQSSAYLGGGEPCVADLALVSLHLNCLWTSNEKFDALPIKWERDLLPRYSNLKRVIDNVLDNYSVKEVHSTALGENCPSANMWNEAIAPQLLAKEMPGKGRDFCFDNPPDKGGMIHPNVVPYIPGMSDIFDRPHK